MFTGIIEALGTIKAKQQKQGDWQFAITSDTLDFSDVALGDSIATNGVCLTVVKLAGNIFWADVSKETAESTSLVHLPEGSFVNLEKAMRADSRFGGHIVTGHVDGLATVENIKQSARSTEILLSVNPEYRRFIAAKGSITLDGTSLTVNQLEANGFWVNVVPHTGEKTIIGSYRKGQQVNFEVDVIARYIEQMLKPNVDTKQSTLTPEFLAQHGFLK